jgi:SNF2 family DNA or RNA helicase
MTAELLTKVVPYSHQIKTLEVYRKTSAVLNGSEMGTGKSLSVIMLCIDVDLPCLIVAPASLCLNWKDEFKKFSDEVPTIYPDISGRIVIISQDIIHKAPKVFSDRYLVAIDECQGFCNVKSRRTKALHQYMKTTPPKKLILMSGTPMKNRIPELYSLFLLMDTISSYGFRAEFPNQWLFNHRYTNPLVQKIGKISVTKFEGFRNLPELRDKWLSKRYIRYKLSDLKDIPQLQYIPVHAAIPLVEVDAGLQGGWMALDLGDTVPTHVMSAKLTSALAKVDFTVDFCQDLLAQGAGPLVVFSDHVEPAMKLADALGGAVITGLTPMQERQTIVRAFQEGKIPVVVGTIGAMGTGLTLTRAHVAVMNDQSYVPAYNYQAVGRILRIGQTQKCLVYTISRMGIDSDIDALLISKARTIRAVFE